MQRAVYNQGFPVKNRFTVKATPYSLILSIPIFIIFSLINKNPLTLIVQALFLLMAVLLCGFSLRGVRVLPLLPILLFVLIVNSFRGGGEILYRAGPFIVMKQGVGRGVYYGVFILELFAMSTILTRSFSEQDLVSAFHSIGRLFSGRKAVRSPARHFSFTLMLFFILNIFHSAYSELSIFFKKSSFSFRERTLLFVHTLFQQAMNDYEKADAFFPVTLQPRSGDVVFVICQILVLVLALVFGQGVFGRRGWIGMLG